jgi:Domain of unknown function (DUF4333)
LHRAHLATGAAALLLLVPLAGCGEKKINSNDLEQKLKTAIGKDAGVPPKEVRCPDDIEVQKGKKFDCTLVAPNGDEIIINVTQTNDKGGFRYVLNPDQPN